MDIQEEKAYWIELYSDFITDLRTYDRSESEKKEPLHMQAAKLADEVLEHMKTKWPEPVEPGQRF